MRGLLAIAVLGLGVAGACLLATATGGFGRNTEPTAALYALIAGLVSWGLATILLIIGMFAFRGRN